VPKSITSIVAFNAGIFSDLLATRTDQAKYRTACRQARNVVIMKQGGAGRRPGTKFIAVGRDQAEGLGKGSGQEFVIRLKKFQFSPTTSFMLEWGHAYLRLFSNKVPVQTTTPQEWDSLRSYVLGQYVAYLGNAYLCIANVPANFGYAPSGDFSHWSLSSPYPTPGHPPQLAPYELLTPYSAQMLTGQKLTDTEVYRLKFFQIGDVVYVTCPSRPVYRLTRISDLNWEFVECLFLTPAMLDQNATDTTLAASGTTGAITLTATAPAWVTSTYYEPGDSVLQAGKIYNCVTPHTSANFVTDLTAGDWKLVTMFQAAHAGSYWQLKYLKDATMVSLALNADGNTGNLSVLGDYELFTEGVWIGDLALERSYDLGVTWETVKVYHRAGAGNVAATGTAAVRALYRLVLTNETTPSTPGTTTPSATLQSAESFATGLVKITACTGDYTATAQVIQELDSTSATTHWSEGAWSGVRGYPNAVTTFDQRALYGGTLFQPDRIWGSRIGDYENFDYGDQTLADDAFAFDLAAAGAGQLDWLNAQNDLFAGFDAEEWVVSTQDGISALSPTNVKARRQSGWGSLASVAAIVVGDACVYAQRNGTSLRQMLFFNSQQKYMSQDLTALADHLFTAGIAQFNYQSQLMQQGVLWAATLDGGLAGMTYELEQEVFGWHQHDTGAGVDVGFESVETLAGKGGDDDECWVVVNRVVGGKNLRYIELMEPKRWTTKEEAYHVDCGLRITSPASDTIAGLTHLVGRSVEANIGGVAYGPAVVAADGTVNFGNYTHDPADVIQIGLHFDSVIQPMNLLVDSRAGDTTGLVKNISAVNLNLYRTLGCLVGDGVNQDYEIQFRDAGDPFAVPALFTGVKEASEFTTDPSNEAPIVIKSNGPLPLTVLGLAVKYEICSTP
jgi:hypothetical protein